MTPNRKMFAGYIVSKAGFMKVFELVFLLLFSSTRHREYKNLLKKSGTLFGAFEIPVAHHYDVNARGYHGYHMIGGVFHPDAIMQLKHHNGSS